MLSVTEVTIGNKEINALHVSRALKHPRMKCEGEGAGDERKEAGEVTGYI